MSPTGRFKRVLTSLSDVSLRIDWLRETLSRSPAIDTARLLNALCEENERSDPTAREALLPLAMYLAATQDNPLIDELRELAKSQCLLSLDRLLRKAPDADLERVGELPVPDYGTGRELTLGERRSLARRPNRNSFEKLLNDPHPLVMRQLLRNPKLTEDDVVRLIARRPARQEALHELTQTTWLSRSRVRLAILLNPGSPSRIAIPLLPLCTRGELLEVLRSDTSAVLRTTAHELIERRPPLEEHEEPTIQ
jgi:hypothetical protein